MTPDPGKVRRIHRKGLPGHIDAFVLAVGDEFALLQPIRERLDLDGYDVIRIADVSRSAACTRDEFYRRALAIKRQRPREPSGIRLDNAASLLKSVSARYPLVVINRERRSPGSCEIGQVIALDTQSYRLKWMNPWAKFEKDQRRFRLADITMVQFDGAYENTLAAVASLTD